MFRPGVRGPSCLALVTVRIRHLYRLPASERPRVEASRLQLGYSETMSLPCAVNAQITVTSTAITTIDQIG